MAMLNNQMVTILQGGFQNEATPIAGCFTMEKHFFKWMMTGGTPISGNLHIPIVGLPPLIS